MEVRVDGRNGQPQCWMIPMASILGGFIPTIERYSVQQTDSKSDLPMLRYRSEGRRTKRTTSMLDDSYGFHTVRVCTYDGEVQRAKNRFEIRASYGEMEVRVDGRNGPP